MRRAITALAVLAVLVVAAATPATSAVEARDVRASMDLQFNLGWPGYQDQTPDWVGTVTIHGEEYGMAFFLLGQAAGTTRAFFYEKWEIYEDLDFAFDDTGVLTTFTPGDVLLSGHDSGFVRIANSRYHMTGTIEEANGDFATYAGRIVFIRGLIEWYAPGVPQYAPGIFRIPSLPS